MPAGLLSAAAVAGAGHTLWSYNRENYMFDVPLRQARDFQKQNVNLARYALFREDIRDLAALTTDKVSNLLVINTLKVGFIVAVYFNFDRTDGGFEDVAWHDKILSLLLGMTLLTSFFFLMTSIWFAMHALQLAQAITTKLLVQVVRIPMPTETDISKAATEGKEFEMNFKEALRVPFIRGNREPEVTNELNSDQSQRDVEDLSVGHSLHRLPHRVKTIIKGPTGPVEDIQTTQQAQTFGPGGPTITSLNELIYGYERMEKTFSQIEPHLKLLSLVASSWQPFDLYSRVTTVLGSSCLFSGLAYYSLYYNRTKDRTEITPEAFACFFFMCTLAWWNLTIEIAGSTKDLTICALFMMVGPVIWITMEQPSLEHNWYQRFSCPILILLQLLWICYLGIRACTFNGVWPHFFTSTRFLNVLHKQRGPIDIPNDIARKAREEDQLVFDDDSSTDSGDMEDVGRAMAMAQPLVDALSCVALQPQSSASRAQVIHARDCLREAVRASGVSRSTVLIKGFYISLETNGDEGRQTHWVDPCGVSTEPEHMEAPEMVNLMEVVEASNQVADLLLAHTVKWTVDDMVNLASYGGEPVAGIHSFLFQFENTSDKSTQFRTSAAYLFKVAMTLVSIFWLLAFMWSVYYTTNIYSRISLDGGELLKHWQLPQPWRMVKSFGCSLGGHQYTITDGYTVQILNHDGSLFLHFDACNDGPVLAVDFGQLGEVVSTCEDGIQATWVHNGQIARQQWISNISMLTDLSVDRTPLKEAGHIDAVAIRKNQLVALRFDPVWRIYGALTMPQNWDRTGSTQKVTALAIRLGRLLVLTHDDELFEMDVQSGQWAGPMLLPTMNAHDAYDWISVCRQARGRWRFVGVPSSAPVQLWAFARPPLSALPPREDNEDPEPMLG